MKFPFSMEAARESELTVLEAGQHPAVVKAPREGALYANATVWRNGINKNHVYLNEGELKEFAASFVGQPFLRDHSRAQESRGGTIVASQLVEDANGGKALRMTLEAVKPWAKEGLKDGTVDRFSIGWAAQKYECTVCESDFFDEDHKHSIFDLGRKDKKTAKTVGVRMYGLEGSEVSAVTHPAVPGTSTDEVLASLKVAMESSVSARKAITPSATGVVITQEEGMKELLSLLGLPADTSDVEALAEVKKRITASPRVPAVLLSALGLSADSSVEQTVAHCTALVPRNELEAERAKNKLIRMAAVLKAAEDAGKLTPAMRSAWAEKLAADDPEQAERIFASMQRVVPEATAPKTADPGAPVESDEMEAAQAAGLSMAQWNEAKARVEHYKKTGTYPPVERKKEVK